MQGLRLRGLLGAEAGFLDGADPELGQQVIQQQVECVRLDRVGVDRAGEGQTLDIDSVVRAPKQ